jgi:hypothetical protein
MELSCNILSLKQQNIEGCKREKKITYKGKPIKITANFSPESLKSRRACSEVFQALNENNFSHRILYPAKQSFKIDGAIKVFHDKQKLKQYMTTKPSPQNILQGILHRGNEANKAMRGQAVPNHRRRKDKESESTIGSAPHNQTLK